MDSSKIIEEFLSSKSSLNDIVSLEKFSKFFDKDIPENELQELFDCLSSQRDVFIDKSRNTTKRTLKDSLDKSIKNLQASRDEYVDERSVRSVTEKLSGANRLFEATSTQLDQEINSVLSQIRQICDRVQNVNYEEILGPLCSDDSGKEVDYIVDKVRKFKESLENERQSD